MIRRRLIVTGRVQGVFYRAWFAGRARALGFDGWVRNRAGGSVEAVVHGSGEQIEAVVAQAWAGPPASHVTGVALHDDAPDDTLSGFAIRPTA